VDFEIAVDIFTTSGRIHGVLGKLSVLTNASLGNIKAYTPANIRMKTSLFEAMDAFHKMTLLDIDTSCIPSNRRGIVIEGSAPDVTRREIVGDKMDLSLLNDVRPSRDQEDFTARIEPDWDSDLQCCLLAFRHRGRLVYRACPSEIELAMGAAKHVGEGSAPDEISFLYERAVTYRARAFTPLPIERLHGGTIVVPRENDTSGVFITANLPKARACVLAMYREGLDQREDLIAYVDDDDDLATVIERTRYVVL
jgi:hypothetical protein